MQKIYMFLILFPLSLSLYFRSSGGTTSFALLADVATSPGLHATAILRDGGVALEDPTKFDTFSNTITPQNIQNPINTLNTCKDPVMCSCKLFNVCMLNARDWYVAICRKTKLLYKQMTTNIELQLYTS